MINEDFSANIYLPPALFLQQETTFYFHQPESPKARKLAGKIRYSFH